ncbi:hypothetical protein FOCC_FOCC014072 [Frankliniella occidentalis]|nr:hypothetical protein FOCC_FOCC014072 [Frankliniella occidentalis]
MDRDSSEQVAFGRPNCTKEAEDLPCQGHDVGPCTRNALCTACDRARALFRGPRVQSLQDIITPMLNAMPKRDRPTISANLTPGKNSGLATRVRQKMAAEMEGRLMSMQVDGCSKRHRHFIGVNVQYIKDNETKMGIHVLHAEECRAAPLLRVNDGCQQRGENGVVSQLDIVDGLLADLLPVYTATVRLQAKDLTLGQLLAIWTEAVIELQRPVRASHTALSKELLKAMEAKSKAGQYRNGARGEILSSLFDYLCHQYVISTGTGRGEQTEQAKEYLVTLWEKVQRGRGVQVEPEVTVQEEGDNESNENPFQSFRAQKNKERAAAIAAASRAGAGPSRLRRGRGQVAEPPPTISGRAKIRAMLEEYDKVKSLRVKSDVLKFWESKKLIWTELYEVALIVLAIPATQVSVERLLSALRYTLRPQ